VKPHDGVSIVIASRANVLGLWATITSCEVLLEGRPHEFIVVVNGQELQEAHQLLQERSGVSIQHSPAALPPPIARNLGAKSAKFPTLCFLDDHVIPTKSFFDWDLEADVVHCSYKTYPNHPLRYFHFMANPECPVKGDYATGIFLCDGPIGGPVDFYPVLSGPHGGFFVSKQYFDESGGYDDFWHGFGGEEAYFGLKANLNGAKVVCNPNALFYHFSCRDGVRGYSKTFNEYNFEEGLRRLGDMTELLKKFQHHKL
jgi:hypothetical protein